MKTIINLFFIFLIIKNNRQIIDIGLKEIPNSILNLTSLKKL